MKKVLFVCHGNICRSPMAEFIMKELVREHNPSQISISKVQLFLLKKQEAICIRRQKSAQGTSDSIFKT